MQRKIKIIDETNNISVEISLDDEKEWLEVWGLEDSNKEKILMVERNHHGFKKSPFAVMPKFIDRK